MNHTTTIIAAFATLTAITTTASAAVLAVSTFDTGDEGWIAQAGPTGTPYAVAWNPTGGVPTGHLEYQDATSQSAEWFSASASFLGAGDFSQAVGTGGVSFDWVTNVGSATQTVQIAFTGNYAGGSILWAELPELVAGGWANYDFAFNPTASWQIEIGPSSTLATMADISGVLSSVDGLFITGDTVVGMDGTCRLDNPTIYGVPAPGALALIGLASLLGTRRRRSLRG
ncbi:MAG TPA: hypothetical protein DGN59_09395 [Candidatus Latescibacteria bacterium]|nr:hypothetical protein [Candidatus Latescibacterota bacterium]|tara:strand:- start:36 stop:719 length:684 start_codon:yes stop_codon:yes gene_type:complete